VNVSVSTSTYTVQIGTGAHTAAKALKLTTHLHPMPGLSEWNYTSTPPHNFMECSLRWRPSVCNLTRRAAALYQALVSIIQESLLIRTYFGRTIAQAVSRWLPIAAARVRSRVRSSGICGGQSDAGAGFLRVLRLVKSK
jgi:hypothetical protein